MGSPLEQKSIQPFAIQPFALPFRVKLCRIQPFGGTICMRFFFSRLCHSPIPGRAATLIAVVALAWGGPAFGGEIHDAAGVGDLAKVQALLKSNPDLVFSKDPQGATPLHFAAASDHMDVAQLLLAHHADVNARDNKGATSLHAAAYGHPDVARLLLANKAAVNAKDGKGDTPLHYAAFGGHRDVAQLLLASKAEVNARDSEGDTPLHFAASSGHTDVVQFLLANNADVDAKDNKGQTPARWAAHNGYKNLAELLRQHGDENGSKEIDDSGRSGDLAKVQALLKGNPRLVFSKDALAMGPLHIAASAGHKDVAEALRSG